MTAFIVSRTSNAQRINNGNVWKYGLTERLEEIVRIWGFHCSNHLQAFNFLFFMCRYSCMFIVIVMALKFSTKETKTIHVICVTGTAVLCSNYSFVQKLFHWSFDNQISLFSQFYSSAIEIHGHCLKWI